MVWTLFWQIFILTNLVGFWAAVLVNGPARRKEDATLLRIAERPPR